MSLMEQLLAEADTISAANVSAGTKSTYDRLIHAYAKVMINLIHEEPFPITHDKMVAFIIFKQNQNMKCCTLQAYINSFTHYFQQNDLEILTHSIKFKIFKSGIRRSLYSGFCPNAKLPFDPKWFSKIIEKFPPTNIDNLKFIFLILLMFAAFLRISEALNLKKSDIVIEGENLIKLNIQTAKTDQSGNGTFTYIYDNKTDYSPFRFINYLNLISSNDHIESRTQSTLRVHLIYVLRMIGVEEYQNYKFHSFRRGAAYYASLKDVNDCIIKAHGRWKSSAYTRYVSVDMSRAGMEISEALSI